jgi:uncharacterized protein (TIGR00730 family)
LADIRNVCVFCGSNAGRDPMYLDATRALARAIAQSGRTLVYGGARVGLMGVLADTALEAGARVLGVIPQALVDREIAHRGLTELQVVTSMHERKARMAELGHAFVALPGGIGTLEELFEIWTWGQLGLHRKPYGLLDVGGYYRPLIAFLDHAVTAGFIKPAVRAMVIVDDVPGRLIERLEASSQPNMPPVLTPAST